jgi:DNA-binding NarL/FixJ family response regulator
MKYSGVVLADRHLNLLGGVHGLLNSLFDTVLMVADERALFEAVAKFNPSLVVVDISLPEKSEGNIAKRLLGAYPALRLIVLSVHDDPTIIEPLLVAGTAGYVLKRTVATDLVPAVHEVLQGGVYVSPTVRDRRVPTV